MKSLPQDERVLVERCLRKDSSAQYQLYKKYARSMYHTAIRIMGERAKAEDALQESFVKVFSNISQFKGQSTLGAWIKRIVINHCISQQRKKKSKMSFVAFEEQAHDQPEVWVDTEMINPRQVHEAVKSLPPGAREILVLYAFEGLRHREIAEQIGISVSTSKTQLHRAKNLLKNILSQTVNTLG